MSTASITKKIVANGRTIEKAIELTATGVARIDGETIAGESTDALVNIAFPYANIKWVYINSTVAMTLETNSGSAADDTLTLAANVPYTWQTGDPAAALLFTADVTKIYATVAGATAGTLDIEIGYDATP